MLGLWAYRIFSALSIHRKRLRVRVMRQASAPASQAAICDTGVQFELGSLLTNEARLALSPHERPDIRTQRNFSTFDDAQAVALANALCRKLALIQSPPGAGESFSGIAIMKALLQNHVLGQLLEHLVTGGVKQIVRLGSRSKSKLLEPCNQRVIAQEHVKTKPEKQAEWKLLQELDETALEFDDELSELRYCGSLKSLKYYLEANREHQHMELFGGEEEGFQKAHLDMSKVISNWLVGKTSPETFHQHRTRPSDVLICISVYDMSWRER